jgi:hypothetical protein
MRDCPAGVEFQNSDLAGPPTVFIVFRNFRKRGALLFGQVAEKCKHDAVSFLHGIAVDFGPRWRFLARHCRDCLAASVAIVLPAVIRTLQAITFNYAIAERTSTMHAGIAQHMCLATGITKRRETRFQHHSAHRFFLAKFGARTNRIPEVYIHGSFGLKEKRGRFESQ